MKYSKKTSKLFDQTSLGNLFGSICPIESIAGNSILPVVIINLKIL